jgi:[NiFe] hydrogenase assembly HybE family chaperone
MTDAIGAATLPAGARLDADPRSAARVRALVALFETIACTRMAGVPMLNPALRVEAVGFECEVDAVDACEPGDADCDAAAPTVAVGILVTPWFMNLVALPLGRAASVDGVGRVESRTLGGQRFEFIGAHEPALGAFSACSLFSPMFEFADPAAARATARAVLDTLRRADEAARDATCDATCDAARDASRNATREPVREAPPARRSFLFGRSAAGAGPR